MKRKIDVTKKEPEKGSSGELDERAERSEESMPESGESLAESGDIPAESGNGPARPEDASAPGEAPTGEAAPPTDNEAPPDESVEEGEAGAEPLDELEAIQEEMDRVRDQYLRLAADFENYRKRVSADLVGVWARAQADLVRSLLEGLDDLQRVSQFTSEDTTVETLIEGVDLVERKLLKALTDAGLEVINPEGESFDPNLMEAMMRVPTEEEGQDETVHQVFQKGYRFKDQLVRPARVSVYKDDD